MKSIFVFLVATFLMLGSFAQDITPAKTFFTEGKLDKAKAAIDAALNGSAANQLVAWIWKHKIYYAISQSETYKNLVPNAMQQGFAALSKAYNMPKGQEDIFIVLGVDYSKPFNDYYVGFINAGSEKMNKESYTDAFENFKAGVSVSTFFYENKLTTTSLDTMLVFYAGYCAMKNNNDVVAEEWFKKLTDRSANGTDLNIAYGWLSNYYLAKKKDVAAAKAVCDKGLLFYPKDDYLLSQQIAILRSSNNVTGLFANYEDKIKAGTADFSDYLGYSAELYDYLFVLDDGHTVENKNNQEIRLSEVLAKTLQLKPESAEANFIAGLFNSSKGVEMSTWKNKTPNEVQKLKDHVKDAIGYLEKTVGLYTAKTTLAAKSKEHLKSAMQQLINLYKYNYENDKAKEMQERLEKL